MLIFCKVNPDISKIKGVAVINGIFPETKCVCTKFQEPLKSPPLNNKKG